MTTLITISAVIFTAYIVAGCFEWGIPRSISRTYYLLNKKGRWLFVTTQLAFSAALILTFESHLVTMAATFIIFSALAADTRAGEEVMKIHTIGAAGGIVLAMAAMIQFGYWYFALAVALFTLVTSQMPMKNHTFWIEVVAYYITVTGMYLYL